MGRKGSSGIQPVVYTNYDTPQESKKGLGLGNGGATDQWIKTLNLDERSAVNWYTGSAYEKFNDALRNGDPLNKTQAKNDQLLQSAMDKYTLDKPTVFHRGSSSDLLGGAHTVDQINAMVGSVVQDDAYLSTSAHSKGGFGGEIKYHINTPAGKGIGAYVISLSQFPHENEFLFRKGSAFKVTGAYEENGQVHCNLEYIGHS